MANSSPAVLSSAIALLRATVRALFTPSRGRHSVAAGRRRRSTRVRRYAPLPTPAQAVAPPAPRPTPRPTTPRPAPRLAPPRERIPAEEVALVRGYYRAFEAERDLARVQADALRRLDQWSTRPPAARPPAVGLPAEWSATPPVGDLLAPIPRPRRAEAVAV